ncbi:MAG: helix-turn-helix domain-containing protein, partial [Patescibacteria group bacterium]|nr:helix-turn-helix domain-containing protein [Patescibacteria group bacterium]
MLEQNLQKLGFSKNETTVYLALFELGKSRAGKIIEHTGLHRNLVYTALEELVKKDLVSKVERRKVAVFEANSPEYLKESIERKLDVAAGVIEELKKKQTTTPRDINVYEGNEGTILTRQRAVENIQPGDTYYVLGISEQNSSPVLDPYFAKLNKKIMSRGAHLKALIGSSSSEMAERRGLTYGENAKSLPFGAETPMWFSFYHDILNISVADTDPVTFSIRSKQAVEGFKKYFEYFWKQPVRMENGMPALKKVFYDMLTELKPGEEYYVFGTALGTDPKYGDFFDQYHRDRIKKGVIVKMLSYQENLREIKERFFVKGGDPEGKISFIKPFISAPPIPMQITMYRGKTRLLFSGVEPVIFYFEQPEVYQGFKKYFEEIWEQDTYIARGPEVLRDLWLEADKQGGISWIGARGYFVDRYPKMFAEIVEHAKKIKGLKWKNIIDLSFKGHALTKLPWM